MRLQYAYIVSIRIYPMCGMKGDERNLTERWIKMDRAQQFLLHNFQWQTPNLHCRRRITHILRVISFLLLLNRIQFYAISHSVRFIAMATAAVAAVAMVVLFFAIEQVFPSFTSVNFLSSLIPTLYVRFARSLSLRCVYERICLRRCSFTHSCIQQQHHRNNWTHLSHTHRRYLFMDGAFVYDIRTYSAFVSLCVCESFFIILLLSFVSFTSHFALLQILHLLIVHWIRNAPPPPPEFQTSNNAITQNFTIETKCVFGFSDMQQKTNEHTIKKTNRKVFEEKWYCIRLLLFACFISACSFVEPFAK